ncbi:hypothetical protein ACHAXT_009681 [Thalassiosira profunda]
MGLCCCTMISCPVGLCAGSAAAVTLGNERTALHPEGRSRRGLLVLFGGLLLAGLLFLYLPLTIMCARADKAPWVPYKGSGHCWSEGTGTGADLGLAAGAVMGTGLSGLLCVLFRGYGHREDSCDAEETEQANVQMIV